MESLKIPRNSRNSQQFLEPFFVGRNKFWGHFLRSWSWIQKSRGSRKVNKRLMGTKGAKGVKGTKGRRGQIGQGGWGTRGTKGTGGRRWQELKGGEWRKWDEGHEGEEGREGDKGQGMKWRCGYGLDAVCECHICPSFMFWTSIL